MNETAPRIQRKYAYTKIGPGDYLLPSNDGHKLFRIARYEDGPSYGVEGMEKDVKLWGVWRYERRLPAPEHEIDDMLDWNYWGLDETWLRTRDDAIQAALRIGERG